jgi:4-hydroxy-3-methylbut-2-enyl diphosphate reductase
MLRLLPSSAVHVPEKLLLAAPRGYCAGVDRAVQTVERALELHGAPVYVRKEIVHNKHVVETLRERGAIFVDELEDTIPEGAITVFSAHGCRPRSTRTRSSAACARSTRPARW